MQETINKGLSTAAYLAKEMGKASREKNLGLNAEKNVSKQLMDMAKNMNLIQNELNDEVAKGNITKEEALDYYNDELDKQSEIYKRIQAKLKLIEENNKKLEVGNALFGAMAKIPIIGPMLGASKAMEDFTLKLEESGSLMKSLREGAGTMVKNLSSGLALMFFKMIVDAAILVDKQVVEVSKNLQISKDEARGLRDNLAKASRASDNLRANATDLLKTMATLNDIRGTGIQYDNQTLITANDLLDAKILTAEATTNLSRAANIHGQELKEATLNQIKGAKSVMNERNMRLDFKKILEATNKVTGQIRAQLGANLELIGEAVATARAFGLELSQVAKIGSSLLKFESSIAAELEAELLTGQQLNLEKARLYALTGDYTNLVKEINAQGMDWNKWSSMNVLQQDAYAKALGLTSDEMSDALLKEKDLSKMAQEARAAGNEELAQQLEKRDAQQKFGDAVEKVKDAFVGLAGPLAIFIEGLANILEPISAAVAGFGKIGAILGLSNEKLTTQQKINWQYGYFEIKAKFDSKKGTWPAIWLLSETIHEDGWPKCGEIDIMEHVNNEKQIHGSLHSDEYNHMKGNNLGNSYSIGNKIEDFNIYGLEWTKDKISWYVNDVLFYSINKKDYFKENWPYDNKYFMILNLAIGGNWPGNPSENFQSSLFIIDWIKVYQ